MKIFNKISVFFGERAKGFLILTLLFFCACSPFILLFISDTTRAFLDVNKYKSAADQELRNGMLCRELMDKTENECFSLNKEVVKSYVKENFGSIPTTTNDAKEKYSVDKLPINEEIKGVEISKIIIKNSEDTEVASKDFGELKFIRLEKSYIFDDPANYSEEIIFVTIGHLGTCMDYMTGGRQGCDDYNTRTDNDYYTYGGLWMYSTKNRTFTHILNVEKMRSETGFKVSPRVVNVANLGYDNKAIVSVNYTINDANKYHTYLVDMKDNSVKRTEIK